ncbi:hypothetical protein [Streptomyces sp. NRRL F-5650]|uniref:hypothetical protein n=1 Tax=Streptomyces sp. NRRL F-5650 TaxID=1463868 RepID=UPI0004CBEC08|nr:hypothetical protein [Streptomyces sp. NRRL F-5650]
MVATMVVLTPTAIRTQSASWTIGWSAILLGAVAVLLLLGLAERLTPPPDRPEPRDLPEA